MSHVPQMDITNLNDFVEDADQVAQGYPMTYPDDSALLSCWGEDPDDDGCGSQSSAAVAAAAASNPSNNSGGGEPPPPSGSPAADKLNNTTPQLASNGPSSNVGQQRAPPPPSTTTTGRRVGGGVNAGGLLYNPLNSHSRPSTGDAGGGGGKNGRNNNKAGGGASRGGASGDGDKLRRQHRQSPIPGGVGGVPMVAVAGAGSQDPRVQTGPNKSDMHRLPPGSHSHHRPGAAPASQQQQIQLQQQLNSFAGVGGFNFLAAPPHPQGSAGAPIVVLADPTGAASAGGGGGVRPPGGPHANVVANSNSDLAAWKWSANPQASSAYAMQAAPQPLAPAPTPPPQPHQQFPPTPFHPAEAGSWAPNGSWGGSGTGACVGNGSVPYAAGAIADGRCHVPQHLVAHQQSQSEAAGIAQQHSRIQEQPTTTAPINMDREKATSSENQPAAEQPAQDTATSQAPGGGTSSSSAAGTPSSSFNLFDAPCELRLNFLKSQQSHASGPSASLSADSTSGSSQDPSRPQERRIGVAQTAAPPSSSSSRTEPQGGAAAGCANGVVDGSTTRHLAVDSSTNSSLVATGAAGPASSNSTSDGASVQQQQTQIFGMNIGTLAPPGALHPAQQQQQPQATTPLVMAQGNVNSSTEVPVAQAHASKQGWCVYINGQQYMLSQPPQQGQQAAGVVSLPPGAITGGGAAAADPGMVVHGLPQQQQGSLPISVAATPQPLLPPLVPSAAAATPGVAPPSSVAAWASAAPPPQEMDHKAQMLKERNEREQRRAQKITVLIDSLRDSMQEGGWKVELKSKYHTLCQSRHYLRHLKRVTREKEEQVRKAREDLDRLRLRRDREKEMCSANMYASEGGGSDPESVLSSLTADSVVKSSRGGDTTMGEGSSRSQGGCESGSNDNMQSSRSSKFARSHDHNSDGKVSGCGTGGAASGDYGDAACMKKKEQRFVIGEDLSSSVSSKGKKHKLESKGSDGSLGEDGDNGNRPNKGQNGRNEAAEEKGDDASSCASPSRGNTDEGEKKIADERHRTSEHGPGCGKTSASHQPHSIRISKQNSTVSDMTNKDETDSNVAICEPILTGGTQCSEASASDGGASPEQHHRHHRGHSRRQQHKDFAAHMLKKVAIVKVPNKRKRVGSSSKGSSPSKRSQRSKSSLDQDFELNYKEVFLTSNVPQLIATPTGRVVTWNKFFLQVTGLTADELKSLTIFSIVQADKLSRLFEIVATALRASNSKKESPALKPISKKPGETNDYISSHTSNPCATTSSGCSTGCASGDGSGDGSTDKEHMTGGGTTASSGTDDSTCLWKSNAFRGADCRHRDKKVRLIDYATVTLPCVKFASAPGGAAVNVDKDQHKSVERQISPKPMYMTVTLMDDKDPRKRCFHCALTDSPGTSGALGSITPNLLAQVFSAEPCPSVIAEDRCG